MRDTVKLGLVLSLTFLQILTRYVSYLSLKPETLGEYPVILTHYPKVIATFDLTFCQTDP